MDKEENVTEIKPIKNLKTINVMEKILVKNIVEAMDMAEILKGLKYNIKFSKSMDTTTF